MSLPDESSRVAASSLLARLGIIVGERETMYLYDTDGVMPNVWPIRYKWVPALNSARKVNSSIR